MKNKGIGIAVERCQGNPELFQALFRSENEVFKVSDSLGQSPHEPRWAWHLWLLNT